MADNKIRHMGLIAINSNDLKKFNDNFNKNTLVSGHGLTQRIMVGPLLITNLAAICNDSKKNIDDISFAVYNDNIIHIVFKDYSSRSAKLDGQQLTFMSTPNASTTWIRLQNFFYMDIKHRVSHAKRAVISDSGVLTLEQLMSKYKQTYTLH